MIRKLVIAEQNNLVVKVPNSYIGKRIEITCIILDEVEQVVEEPKNVLSKYKGALKLSKSQERDFENYVNEGRAEWNKEI